MDQGETVCLVGESGCGKSITSLAVMGLLGRGGRVSQGEILFNGRNLLKMDRKELDQVRGKELSMIFQDPLSSLNPVLTIGKQLEEGLKAHTELGLSLIHICLLLRGISVPEYKGRHTSDDCIQRFRQYSIRWREVLPDG